MPDKVVKVMLWGSSAGWAFGGVDAWMASHLLTDDQARWVLVTTAVVAIIGAAKHLHRPVHQVWDAGREAGRREAIREMNGPGRLVSLERERARRSG